MQSREKITRAQAAHARNASTQLTGPEETSRTECTPSHRETGSSGKQAPRPRQALRRELLEDEIGVCAGRLLQALLICAGWVDRCDQMHPIMTRLAAQRLDDRGPRVNAHQAECGPGSSNQTTVAGLQTLLPVAHAAKLLGLTPKAIRRKIDAGKWRLGLEFYRAPDNCIFVDIHAAHKWIKGTPQPRNSPPLASKYGQPASASSSRSRGRRATG